MNADLIRREFDAYRRDDEAAQALLNRADGESRALNAEEEEQFDKLFESARSHKARADKLGTLDEQRASLETLVAAHVGSVADPESGKTESSESFNARLITNLRDTLRAVKGDQKIEERTMYGIVDLERRAIADFSDSGALYTTEFSTQVAIYQRTASPWIDLAYVMNADNGRPMNVPNLTADPTSYSPGEGTAITESTPTIGSAALTTTAYKDLAYLSAEAEEDELVGWLPYIARVQGRSIGLKFGSDLTTTILAAINNGGTAGGTGGNGTAASTFFGYEDLIDLKLGRQAPYRKSGAFIVANAALKKIRKFKDQNGFYFFNAASNPQGYDTFDGNPIFEDPYLAAPASATKSVIFGDVSLGVAIKQMPLRVATSTEFRFNTDQVALKTVYRAGAAVPDATALAYLVSANT